MSKIWVKEISHPGGTATFQAKVPPDGDWVDVFIRSGSTDFDIDDFNERVDHWKKEKKESGIEVIEVPNI